MKKFLFLAIAFLVLTPASISAQNEIRIDSKSIIKDPDGTQIDLLTFTKRMDTEAYTINPATDADGKKYYQLRKITENERRISEVGRPKVGTPAPYFNLTDMDGNNITSDNTKGKIVVFNFWFTSCPPCIEELPQLNELYAKFQGNEDIVFAAVTFEQAPKIEKFLKRFELNYPIIPASGATAQQYSGGGYPTNVILDREGNFHKYVGGGHSKIGLQLEVAIGEALAKK